MTKIARVWFGKIPASKTGEYIEYVNQTGIQDLTKTKGNLGAWLLTRSEGETTEVGVISLWESREAIERFAGKNIAKAVYYPEDDKYLFSLDPELVHYEVRIEAPKQTDQNDRRNKKRNT